MGYKKGLNLGGGANEGQRGQSGGPPGQQGSDPSAPASLTHTINPRIEAATGEQTLAYMPTLHMQVVTLCMEVQARSWTQQWTGRRGLELVGLQSWSCIARLSGLAAKG